MSGWSEFIVESDFVQGRDFNGYLAEKGGKIPADALFNIFLPVVRALGQLHAAGGLHIGICPENLIITDDLVMKLKGLGVNHAPRPGFSAPEIMSGGEVGTWSDVFSVCAVMYYGLTGFIPPAGGNVMRPGEMGARITPDQEAIIMCGLAPDPRSRFINADFLFRAMQSICGANINEDSVNTAAGDGIPAVPFRNETQNMFQNGEAPEYPDNRAYNNNMQHDHAPGNYNNAPNTPGGYAQYARSRSGNNGVLIGVIAGISALILIFICVAGVNIYRQRNSGMRTGTGSAGGAVGRVADTPTDEPTEKPTEKPTEAPKPPRFTDITASSTRGTDYTSGTPVNYYPQYAIDGDMSTAWSPNRAYGSNPYITLSAGEKQHVTGIRMTNGYMKSSATYYRNRRITRIEIIYESGSEYRYLNPDEFGMMQDIQFDAPVNTTFITIKVIDSIYGDWKDYCISELEVY